jgi:hypothetical protein
MMEDMKPDSLIVKRIIIALKTPQATNIPQNGEVILKIRQNSCLPASTPLAKSKSAATASLHKIKRIASVKALKRVTNVGIKYFINVIRSSVSSHINLKLTYFQIILFFTFSATAFANNEFTFNPNKKIETLIAANELNRIQITNNEIIEVIGDESKYILHWSSDWRNLFVKPKVEVGETFELSLIMPSGVVQDIRFIVGDITPQTIFINSELSSTRIPRAGTLIPLSNPYLKSEIASMMQAMMIGVKGKYYIIDAKRILQQNEQMLITQIVAYRYRDLSGAVLFVKNLTSKPINLSESDFKYLFKNTYAINLSSALIKPRASTQIFLITIEAPND